MDSANEAKMDGGETIVFLKCKCEPEVPAEELHRDRGAGEVAQHSPRASVTEGIFTCSASKIQRLTLSQRL